jgi:hypothetical protein
MTKTLYPPYKDQPHKDIEEINLCFMKTTRNKLRALDEEFIILKHVVNMETTLF